MEFVDGDESEKDQVYLNKFRPWAEEQWPKLREMNLKTLELEAKSRAI